jgi:hypothetical protein
MTATTQMPAGTEGGGSADPYVTAIRDAVASGWGVVIAGAHVRTAYEAARAFGRLGEVTLIHARPSASLWSYVGVDALRVPEGWDCGKWNRHPHNGLPTAGISDMARPGRLTLLFDVAKPEEIAPPIAAAMVGGATPVLLVHAWSLSAAGRPIAPVIVRLPEDAPMPHPSEAAFSRFATLPSGSEDGFTAVIRGGGRTVMAQYQSPMRMAESERHKERASVRVMEAESDGWVSFAEWRSSAIEPSHIAAFASFAWLHGTYRPHGMAEKAGVSTVATGSLPWRDRRLGRDASDSDNEIADVFGEDGIELQESLVDIVPARAVYRAAVSGDRTRRIQFLRTWPGFKVDLLAPSVAAAVDAGERMAPVLANLHGVTAATVRRLAGRQKPILWRLLDERFHVGAGAAAIAAIGHDRLPDREDEVGWEAFDNLSRYVFDIVNAAGLHHADGDAAFRWFSTVLAAIPGRDWPARKAALGAYGGHSRGGPVLDTLREMASHLRLLGVARADLSVALRMFPAEAGFGGILAASRAWHEDPVLSLGSHGIKPETSWEVPFDPVDLDDGWRAVPLDSMRALVAEGSHEVDVDGLLGLSHCVASYARRCLRGESLIVSIRRVGETCPTRVTTAELVHDPKGTWRIPGARLTMTLAQHRGRRNAAPPNEARDVLERLRAWLMDGTVPSRMAGHEKDPSNPVAGAAELQALAVHPRWRAVLPGRLGRLDARELAAFAREVADRVRGPG